MKIKLSKIMDAQSSLAYLSTIKCPAQVTLKIFRLMRSITPEIQDFEKVRTELVKKYGKPEGNLIKVDPENFEKFTQELNEIREEEIELNFEPILLSTLTAEFSADDLLALDGWVISTEN